MPKILRFCIVPIILPLFLGGCSFVPPDLKVRNLPLVWGEPVFKWGVHLHTYPLNLVNEGFHPERVEEEMKLVKELGVNYCRFNLEFADHIDQNKPTTTILDEVNDTMINIVVKNGCLAVVVLEAGARFTEGTLEDSYNLAYERAYNTATRYKGKVKYYQILNEVTGVTIWKEGDEGDFLSDPYGYKFNKAKYDRAKAWLQGFSEGIKKADPDAKRVVTGHWIWYKVIDYLIQDGLEFEVLGWAWFSPDGIDVTKIEVDYGTRYINMAEELSEFNKELWIIESNRDKGSYDPENQGEEKQADFINKIIKNVYKSGYFKGYFIFPLMDTPPEVNNSVKDNHWGIIKIQKDPDLGIYQFGEPKKAFWVYRDYLTRHP